MTWVPAPRADWVDQANRGELPEFTPDERRFDAPLFIESALAGQDRDDVVVGADRLADLHEPLGVFCHALEQEAGLTPLGRWATQRFIDRLLAARVGMERYRLLDPGVDDERIVEPIFVIGAPRTGTTALHRLLAADPAHRVPEGWEFAMPAPPPTVAGHETDPRIAAMADELVFPQSVAQGLRAIHTYSARMPKECLSAMSLSGRTEEFISRYHVPSYVDWLAGADLQPAYDMHRFVLQTLQRSMPTERWVLKSPVHLQAIPELAATYPDARFVVTHREPASILASVSSLIATLRSAFSDDVDAEAIGRYHVDLYARSLDLLVDHCDGGVLGDRLVAHTPHRALLDDPDAALDDVYAQLELPRTDSARRAAADQLHEEREDHAGAHHYVPADFGISTDDADRFDRYRRRFLAAPAGRSILDQEAT